MDKRENSEYVLKILFLVMTVLFSYVIIHCLNAWDTLQVEGYGGLSDAINMGLKHLKEKPFQIRYSNSVKNNLWVIGLVIFVAYGLLFFNRHVTLFGREFGSARWANRKEERAFADKEEKKNVIMSMNIRMSLNPRVSKRNLNILLVGGSGAGKTRYFVKPNIMQMNCSYIITDPKGDTFKSTAKMLEDAGYEVILFNLFEKGNSACYNFFSYIHKESDILKLATLLIRGTKPAEQQNAASDPFWDNAGILLAEAFIGYIWLEEKEERKNMETFMELLSQASASEEDENQKSCVDEKFERLEKEHGSNYFPCKQYNLYKKAAGKTAKSILITLGASLSAFNLKEIIELTRTDTLHLESLGDKKKALFILISDTDKSMNFLVSMLYTQLFDELSFRADFGEVKWTEGQTYYHSRYSLIDKREDLEKLYKEYISAEGDKKRDRLYQKIYQKMDEIEEEFGIPPLKERVISEEVIDKYIHAINDLSRRMNRKKEQLKVYYKNLVHVNKALSLIQQSKGEVRRNVKSIEQKEIDKFKRLKDIIHRRLLYEYGISAEYKGKDAEEKFLGDINLLIKELYKNDNLYGSEKTLRERIEYIPQETFLFSGSIFENLTLGLDDATMDDIIEASKMAQAHDFINELPLRYETRLEENGSNLSGGQKQRLAIARAMLKKPDILILDEATSNLDAITERALDRTIHEFAKDMTTIFIAHRLSTIKNCDRIYVMDKGKIVEEGTHRELITLGGKYAYLVKQQSLEENIVVEGGESL